MLSKPNSGSGNELKREWIINGFALQAGQQFDTGERHYPNGTLIIHKTTYNSQGVLVCRVTSTAGQDQASVQLVIQHAPPQITYITPGPVTTSAGEKIELVCEADGIPMPRIVWRIPTASATQDSGSFRSSTINVNQTKLTITNISPNDVGSYSEINKKI